MALLADDLWERQLRLPWLVAVISVNPSCSPADLGSYTKADIKNYFANTLKLARSTFVRS
jgi:hypothetical protein